MTNKEKTLGQKVDEMTNKISEVSSELGEKFEATSKETQKVAHDVEKWWKKTSLESRITTLLGGFLVVIALWNLKFIIWQLAVLIVGVLGLTGMFDGFVKEAISFIKKQTAKVKKEEKAEKSED